LPGFVNLCQVEDLGLHAQAFLDLAPQALAFDGLGFEIIAARDRARTWSL
jgi:hypothetical protein